MELPGITYLYTLATVSITFVGFSTLFILIRQALGKTMSKFDILLTKNFLQPVSYTHLDQEQNILGGSATVNCCVSAAIMPSSPP